MYAATRSHQRVTGPGRQLGHGAGVGAACVSAGSLSSGGEGNRTPGLFDATEALYQLSYTPEAGSGRIYLRGGVYSFAVRRIILTIEAVSASRSGR